MPPFLRTIPIASASAVLSSGDGAVEPPQAAELPAALTRRRAMQLMAASTALAAGACTRTPQHRIYPYVDMPEAGRHGLPIYYASAFVRDGHAHGVLIGTREGRPIKIEGNPAHPSSLGATDVYAQASVLQLWDPDRLQGVWQRLERTAPAGPAQRSGGDRGAEAPQRADERPRPQPQDGGSPPQSADDVPAQESAASTWSAFESAWRAREPRLRGDAGARLRVLTAETTSPTLQAQLGALLKRFPRARWHAHAPLAPLAAREGARLAFGRAVQPLPRFDRARFVLSLASDPFSHSPGSLRHARDWARQRAAAAAAGTAPAHAMALEATPGLFGARADERLARPPAAIEASLWRIAAQLHADLPPPPQASVADEASKRFEARAAARLRRHGADSLIVAGDSLSAPSQALVHLLNQRQGAVGRTLDFIAVPGLQAAGDGAPASGEAAPLGAPGTLAELTAAMQAGEVDTLLVLGGNPAYDAPADVPFAAALARVPFSIRLGLYRDETAQRCVWQLPASHDYEQWSDALAHDGTATLIQPAIAPLYDSRSVHELLALLADDAGERSGHALVRRTWRALRPGTDADFEAFWRASLTSGVVAGSASAPLALPPATLPPPLRLSVPPSVAEPGAGLVVPLFVADPSVGDGSFANNGWLQELPRPFTKLTWDNALHLGPATAAALGVATGDVVRASVGGRSVEAPVWVQAGHAEGAATLPLGYGRSGAGRVGDGIGFDAYRLRLSAGAAAATYRLQLQPTGRRHEFAVTQHEIDQHGRELARRVAPGGRIAHPDTSHASLYPPIAYEGRAWGMAIDLDACIGCNACTIACQAENNIPVVGAEEVARGREMHWIRVDHYREPDGESLFLPVPCMHCENAPCEVVCPVGATVHDSAGLNVQVYNRCIGTRFCSNNCPYKVRRFNFLQYADTETESLKAQRNPDVTVRQRGVMEKCTYCLQRLSRARIAGEISGVPAADGDVVTACQSVCPTRAIHFGDLNDPAADVVRAKASPRHYALLGELNTRPRTTYLARVAPDAKVEP